MYHSISLYITCYVTQFRITCRRYNPIQYKPILFFSGSLLIKYLHIGQLRLVHAASLYC